MRASHTVSSFDDDLGILDELIAEMGGLARDAWSPRRDPRVCCQSDGALAQRVISDDVIMDARAARNRRQGDRPDRQAPADGAGPARSRRRDPHRRRSRAHRRPRQEHRQARHRGRAERQRRATSRAASSTWPSWCSSQLKDVLDAYAARDADGACAICEPRRGDRRNVHVAVPRAPDLHDGRSAQHHRLHASSVLRQEHRAHRRPRHQHRRDDLSTW